jgi:hypothetical protein
VVVEPVVGWLYSQENCPGNDDVVGFGGTWTRNSLEESGRVMSQWGFAKRMLQGGPGLPGLQGLCSLDGFVCGNK